MPVTSAAAVLRGGSAHPAVGELREGRGGDAPGGAAPDVHRSALLRWGWD